MIRVDVDCGIAGAASSFFCAHKTTDQEDGAHKGNAFERGAVRENKTTEHKDGEVDGGVVEAARALVHV